MKKIAPKTEKKKDRHLETCEAIAFPYQIISYQVDLRVKLYQQVFRALRLSF